MYDINLLKDLYTKDKKSSRLTRFSIVLLIMGVIFIAFSIAYFSLDYLESRNEDRNKQILKQNSSLVVINETKRQISDYKMKVKKLSDALDSLGRLSTAPTTVLNLLTEAMPQNVFIVNCTMSSGSVSMSAKSKDYKSIAAFVYNLENTGFFKNITVSGINVSNSKEGDASEYVFSVSAKYD